MGLHANLNHYEFVTTAPTTAPAAGELHQKLQSYVGGLYEWTWNYVDSQWEGGNYRPGSYPGSPNSNVDPLFAGMEVVDTLTNKKYYASSTSNTSWIDYGY